MNDSGSGSARRSYAAAGRRATGAAALAVAAIVLACSGGCVSPGPARAAARPVTISEVRQWAMAGVDSAEIAARIRESGSVFRLSSEQVVTLRRDGVPGEVVDEMMATLPRHSAAEARRGAWDDAYRSWAWDPWCRAPWWWEPHPWHGPPYGAYPRGRGSSMGVGMSAPIRVR